MSSTLLIVGGIVLLVFIGAALAWRLAGPRGPVVPPPTAANQGYGTARWHREIALWEGTLRRLQTQAAQHPTPPPHLAGEIARAEARLARAHAALAAADAEASPPD